MYIRLWRVHIYMMCVCAVCVCVVYVVCLYVCGVCLWCVFVCVFVCGVHVHRSWALGHPGNRGVYSCVLTFVSP